MIEVIIALILLFVGIVACIIWSANTAIKWQRIFTEIFACVGVLALCTIVGCGAMLPERDTAEAAKIETSEVEITPTDTEATVSITIPESITTEQLIKMFLDKWDGVLPDNITIMIGEQNDN